HRRAMFQSRNVLLALGRGNALPLFFEFVHHLCSNFGSSWMPGQKISCGEKKALKRFCVRRDIANQLRVLRRGQKFIGAHYFLCFEVMRNVKNSLAFANGKGLLVNAAVRDLPEYVVSADGMIKEILAGLQPPFGMPPRVKLKGKRTANDAVLFQEPRHRAAGSAMRQIDEYARIRKSLIRPLDGIP